MGYDYLNSVGLLVVAAGLVIVYGIRWLLKGRAQFDRVERQGGSVLLGKGMMEMAYWGLQPLARTLVRLNVTPNQISWVSLVLGGVAGTFLAYGYFGAGALCATLSAFLDSLDGMVARMTGMASDSGEVLDAAIDRYVEFFYLAGLVLYYREIPYLQLLALFALMGSFMVSYSTAKAEALHLKPPPGIMRRPERAFYLILGAALSALPIPWLGTQLELPVRVGLPMVISLGFVAILANVSAIERLYTIAKAIREIEAGETSPETEATRPDPAPPSAESGEMLPHHRGV